MFTYVTFPPFKAINDHFNKHWVYLFSCKSLTVSRAALSSQWGSLVPGMESLCPECPSFPRIVPQVSLVPDHVTTLPTLLHVASSGECSTSLWIIFSGLFLLLWRWSRYVCGPKSLGSLCSAIFPEGAMLPCQLIYKVLFWFLVLPKELQISWNAGFKIVSVLKIMSPK